MIALALGGLAYEVFLRREREPVARAAAADVRPQGFVEWVSVLAIAGGLGLALIGGDGAGHGMGCRVGPHRFA